MPTSAEDPHGPDGVGVEIVRISVGRREMVVASDELIGIVELEPRLDRANDRRPDRIAVVTSKDRATPDRRAAGE